MLSIVTPAYNAGRWLAETLDSVAALPIEHEHIVVDGASRDGTVEMLRDRDDPSLRWISEPDGGQASAVNKGLAMARGDLMMWVNADDEIVVGGVVAAVEHLERNPDVQVVYGGLDFMDAVGSVRREYRPADWSFRRYLFLGDYVQTPTIIWRRSRWQRVGPLDEGFEDASDYDFYLRLMHGVRVDNLPAAHVRFRWHDASKTGSNAFRGQDEALRIRLRWARNPRDRAIMVGFDRAKRALLPVLTRGRWPAPFPE